MDRLKGKTTKYDAMTNLNAQNQNHDASIRSQHTDIITVTTDTTLKILSLSTHNIFSLKIPELHKKHISELRLHLLGSDNGHVVKH